MSLKHVLASLLLGAIVSAPALAADKYEIDPNHSYVGFSVKHMMVSTVKGHFKQFSGTIQLDQKEMLNSSVEVSIKADSIDTGNDTRDNDLKTNDQFFTVAKFPDITFKSSKVLHKGSDFIAVGTLTIRDVAKEVQIPFQLAGPVTAGKAQRIGADGELVINRRDYGVIWSKTLDGGSSVVSDEVHVELHVEAVHQL